MKRLSSILLTASLVIATIALTAACKQQVSATEQPVTANDHLTHATASQKVTKVVFIGKQNACDCTRKRVEDSFAALNKALQGHSAIDLERFQVDVHGDAVARFKKLRPIMVLPAVYFLEGSGTLIDMLQGELTVGQVQKVVGK